MCGKKHNIIHNGVSVLLPCQKNRSYILFEDLFNKEEGAEKERWFNAIYIFIERTPFKKEHGTRLKWYFYYETTTNVPLGDLNINVFQLMKQYPYQVVERIDQIMINLSDAFPSLADHFCKDLLTDDYFRLLYCESNNRIAEVESIVSALKKCDYIEICDGVKGSGDTEYRISIEGWRHIADIKRKTSFYKYGFIAMSFSNDAAYIENVLKKAITEAGYEPRIFKDYEHNNYIMPEIFSEIHKSRFVVVDITIPNYGAYYEAGYAQAIGKEVIVCCKSEIFNDPDKKPHFDIAQKSMIIWNDEADLLSRLIRRIEATIQ